MVYSKLKCSIFTAVLCVILLNLICGSQNHLPIGPRLVNNHHLLMSIISYKLFFNNLVFVCSLQLQFRVINNLICHPIMIHFLIINHFWNSINSIKQWFHEINWSLKLLVFWWKAKIGIKINWQPLHCWLSWSKGTSELLTTRRLDYFHFNIR